MSVYLINRYIYEMTCSLVICIGKSMVSSAIWKKHARVSFSNSIKIARVRRTSSIWGLWKTHECVFFQIAWETMLLLINNIHEKIMQNWVIRLRRVQNNLFTSNCQYFHNEKTFVRTTEVKQCVLSTIIVKISKIALFPFLALYFLKGAVRRKNSLSQFWFYLEILLK